METFRLYFHSIAVILSVILLFIDDPGFDSVWIWSVGSLILNLILLIQIIYDRRRKRDEQQRRSK